MSFDVEGKVALITGANRGIGKAIAEVLLQHGAAKIYAAVRDLATAELLVKAHGNKVVPVEVDLTNPESIARAAQVASDVELVVNNAGILSTKTPLSAGAIETLRSELQTNVFGLIHVAKAFAPVLAANGGGAFVQLNSLASIKCFPAIATYSASKAAAYSVTQALRAQLAKQGTLVISVHPGPIATDMGNTAELADIAEPPEVVGQAIVESLKSASFHCFPDSMAKKLGAAYDGFARFVIESNV